MYDDYDLDYIIENDYGYNLDEDSYYESYTQLDELDFSEDDYDRNSQDYQQLAYNHYAWYNV